MSSLDDYLAKRNLRRTPEPSGDTDDASADPLFVIQKHDASSLHYDVRLEVDGVLTSWAVPKGPSTDPRDKRLAQPTEAHPLDYATFEGVIPDGNYGAGTVLVWDLGPYRNLRADEEPPVSMTEALDEGKVEVWLEGQKIRGGYALIRMDDADDRWLLIKMDDDEADARRNPTSTQPASVLSDRTLDDIAEQDPETP
jgi:DNA ligase D-like protein (predicted 3'-phosphoesterase)